MAKPLIMVANATSQITDKSQPPILLTTVPESFYKSIGSLITKWAVMEEELNILIWALSQKNSTPLKMGWEKSNFTTRFDTLKSEWAKFSKNNKELTDFPSNIYSKIQTNKTLRDSIAHKQMTLSLMPDNNHFVQFYNEVKTKQKSKPYNEGHFASAAQDAVEAAGWFRWVCESDSEWPLSDASNNALRSLPSTEHLRLPH